MRSTFVVSPSKSKVTADHGIRSFFHLPSISHPHQTRKLSSAYPHNHRPFCKYTHTMSTNISSPNMAQQAPSVTMSSDNNHVCMAPPTDPLERRIYDLFLIYYKLSQKCCEAEPCIQYRLFVRKFTSTSCVTPIRSPLRMAASTEIY